MAKVIKISIMLFVEQFVILQKSGNMLISLHDFFYNIQSEFS